MHFTSLSALAVLAASAVVHAEEDRYMPCFNDICWTSWKCRYSKPSSLDGTIGKRCGLPSNVYTPGNDGVGWNTLVWGQNYMMDWVSNDASQAEPIILEWLMFQAPGTETPIRSNETEMYPDYRGKGPEKFVVAFSQTIPPSTVGWVFQPSLSSFPNENLNATPVAVTGYAMERNIFRIYHPKTFDPKNATTYDFSEPFLVIRPWEKNMIDRAVENKGKADNKKLAIGVGIGISVTWFVAFLVSWYTSAWFERRSLSKKGFLLK